MGTRSTQILTGIGIAIAAAFAIAVAVVLLGGGETTSKESYQATLVNSRDRVDFALERITKSQSIEELLERLDEASALVGDVAADLDQAGVAEGFEEDNDKIVQTLRSFSDELAGTAAQFRDPSFAPTLDGINSLGFTQWDELNAIFAKLSEEGIVVPPLERH